MVIAVSSFGGPIALIRNERKLVTITSSLKPILHIVSSYGQSLLQLQMDKRLIAFGWTHSEKLVCVLETSIRVHDLTGAFVQLSLGEEAKNDGIYDAKVYDSGVVLLTNTFQCISITDLDEPRPKKLADTGLKAPPSSWAILPPTQSLSGHLEVFLSVNNTLLVVDSFSVQDQGLTSGPFTKIVPSPNGKFVALFNTLGKLLVMSSDFQSVLAELPTNSSSPPLQVAWCGSDAVLLHWEDTLLVVGPTGDWIKFSYEGVVYICSELDGARIISNDKLATENVFKIGSTAPSAILYDASRLFEKQSPKAYENISSIKSQLFEAVEECVEAAGNELSPFFQKALLKAASFGKNFLESYPTDKYVSMARIIRVLNAIRDPAVGIPLTLKQYSVIKMDGLIEKLLRRHCHLLAKRICEYVDVPSERVLVHWACVKVSSSVEDEDSVCNQVIVKLKGAEDSFAGISFAEIATAAYTNGRVGLATKLLQYEPLAGVKVPLLMDMQQDEIALDQAILSNDKDLVYLVLLHLMRKLPLADFFRILNGKPIACTLFEHYCKEQNQTLLRDFYYQGDRVVESANLLVSTALAQTDIKDRIAQLQVAGKMYHDHRAISNLEDLATSDQVKLLKHQMNLEKDLSQVFVDLTASQTISKILGLGHRNRALDLKKDLHMSDKVFAWLEVNALISTDAWDSLETFSKSSSNVKRLGSSGLIGILDALMRGGHGFQAQKWIEAVTKPNSIQAKELSGQLEQWQHRFLGNAGKSLDVLAPPLSDKKERRPSANK